MPREHRVQIAGATYHVWSRAARGLNLYVDEEDRKAFQTITGISVSRAGWICHAYCQMGTHYHFLLETPSANIGDGMKRQNWLYSRTFNERHGTRGHLFESRYGAVVIQSHEHFFRAYRYIVRNPVEVGLVRSPLDWPWSSYAATVGLAPVPHFLSTSFVLGALSSQRAVARRQLRWIVEGIEPDLGAG